MKSSDITAMYIRTSSLDTFELYTKLCYLDHEELKMAYKNLSEVNYKLKTEYDKLKNNWIIKLLIKLKIIKCM